MHKSLRIGLAVLLSSSAAFFSACSSYNDPEPAQPELVQALSSAATDASTIVAAQTWFTRVSQQSAHPVGIDWPQARTAGNWVVAPLVDSLNIFAQVPQQGFRYLVIQVQATGACNGRIVEVMLPTKSLTADQALTTVLAGVQPLVAGTSPAHLGAFTGCVFVYSPTYAYQTGLLYQNGVAQGRGYACVSNAPHQ